MPVEVEGIEEVIAKLEGLDKPEIGRRPMTQSVGHLLRRVAVYPPATQANREPGIDGYRWYERGFGTKTVTGKAYNTSESLGSSWTKEISTDGRRGSVGTKVTYSPYVQDRDKQAAYHKARGWNTAQDIAEKEADEITGYFEAQYQRYINS